MSDRVVPRGVWAVALTPFKQDRAIDWPAYEALLEHYAASGLHGVFTACASSEVTELTADECVALTRAAVTRVGDRLPVVAGVRGGPDITVVAEVVRRMTDAGAAAVILTPNTLAGHDEDDDVLLSRIERLMTATDPVPLGLYECPLPYRRLISPEAFRVLARSGRFVFHKDTSCDVDHMRAKIAAANGTVLRLYNANMQTLPASLRAGAAGYCGVATNTYPDLVVRLWESCGESRAIETRLHAFLVRAEEVFGPTYPRAAKQLLAMQGVPVQPICRMPVLDDDASIPRRLRALLDAVERFRHAQTSDVMAPAEPTAAPRAYAAP